MIGVYVVYVVAVTLADGANSCLGHVTSSANYSSVLCFHLLIWARVMLLCARVEGGANDQTAMSTLQKTGCCWAYILKEIIALHWTQILLSFVESCRFFPLFHCV